MKTFHVSNPGFIERSHKSLVLPPYAVDVPVSAQQFEELKAAYPKQLTFRIHDTAALATDDMISLVEQLDLSSPVKKALSAANVATLAELAAMTADQLLAVKGITELRLTEIVDALKSQELTLKEAE